MRERKRRHDDAHRPMTGKGARAMRKKTAYPASAKRCPYCGNRTDPHLCSGPRMQPMEGPTLPAGDPFNDHTAEPVMTMEDARRIISEANR